MEAVCAIDLSEQVKVADIIVASAEAKKNLVNTVPSN